MSAAKPRPAGNVRQPLPVRVRTYVRGEIFRLVSYLPFLAIKTVWWPVTLIGSSSEAIRDQISMALAGVFGFTVACLGYWVLTLNGLVPVEGWAGFGLVALSYVIGADKESAYDALANWSSRNFTRKGLKSRIAYLVSRLLMVFDYLPVKSGIVGLINGAVLAVLAGWIAGLFG
jgi:hypothetical protein